MSSLKISLSARERVSEILLRVGITLWILAELLWAVLLIRTAPSERLVDPLLTINIFVVGASVAVVVATWLRSPKVQVITEEKAEKLSEKLKEEISSEIRKDIERWERGWRLLSRGGMREEEPLSKPLKRGLEGLEQLLLRRLTDLESNLNSLETELTTLSKSLEELKKLLEPRA